MFTARYELSPYITRLRFVLKGLMRSCIKFSWRQYREFSNVGTLIVHGVYIQVTAFYSSSQIYPKESAGYRYWNLRKGRAW